MRMKIFGMSMITAFACDSNSGSNPSQSRASSLTDNCRVINVTENKLEKSFCLEIEHNMKKEISDLFKSKCDSLKGVYEPGHVCTKPNGTEGCGFSYTNKERVWYAGIGWYADGSIMTQKEKCTEYGAQWLK